MHRIRRIGSIPVYTGLLLILLVLFSSCSDGEQAPIAVKPGQNEPYLVTGVEQVDRVMQLTGQESPNKTDQYGVFGTDLGSMFNDGEKTYFVFGDTFGYREPEQTGGGGEDWRSNTMAFADSIVPSEGITLQGMIEDRPGHAKELIPSLKSDYEEMTVIPTHGYASSDGTMYLYFMSVKHWGNEGSWEANYSGVAKSLDEGQSWQAVDSLRWPGDSGFVQVSPFAVQLGDGRKEVYFWTIPAGRFGGVKLMKAEESRLERQEAYVYYTGLNPQKQPQWSADMTKAATLIEDTVGELSVIWNEGLQRWIMMYLQEGTGIVLREALTPWGPWNDAVMVAGTADFPGLYGAYMNPKLIENKGRTIYFTMSLWNPYNVFWMKADLMTMEE